MNHALQAIFSRRSIRNFTPDKDIPNSMIHDLLEAAMAAPSAMAKDPWHFIVVRERKTLDTISSILPNGKMLHQAPVAIIICGDINKAHDKLESYMLQDLSAAVENILLAANILELGSCWLGIHPRPDRMEGIKKLFSLPEMIIPMCGVALGWPTNLPEARTRYQSESVHLENW